MINNSKVTKLSGYDRITMKTLKQIPYFTALTITHLVDNIIFTKNFPDCLKVSWIVPISKKGKPLNKMESFRPICNLSSIEKLVEECLKEEVD